MDGAVRLEVEPGDTWFARGSDQWYREQEDLRLHLVRSLGASAVRETAAEPDGKGLPLVPIIVALGGAKIVQSVAECFDAWLRHRGRDRSINATLRIGDREIVVHVTAENAAIDALKPIVERLGTAVDSGE